MNGVYLLLGSNIGDRLSNLKKAQTLLQECDLKVLNESSIYETEPWGKSEQSWFLNVVVQIETILTPQRLLEVCLGVEQTMDRIRGEKWDARIIDIDILYYNHEVINSAMLKVPHPEIPNRRFTLVPLSELCPNQPHPILGQTQVELLVKCEDELDCKLTEFQL